MIGEMPTTLSQSSSTSTTTATTSNTSSLASTCKNAVRYIDSYMTLYVLRSPCIFLKNQCIVTGFLRDILNAILFLQEALVVCLQPQTRSIFRQLNRRITMEAQVLTVLYIAEICIYHVLFATHYVFFRIEDRRESSDRFGSGVSAHR